MPSWAFYDLVIRKTLKALPVEGGALVMPIGTGAVYARNGTEIGEPEYVPAATGVPKRS